MPSNDRHTGEGPGPRPADDLPWIETRGGGLFFANVLLVTPIAVALFPLLLGALLRTTGSLQGPSPMFDTIPTVAAWAAPGVGWLAAPAAWFAGWSRSQVERRGARAWLAVFLFLHLLTLAYTVWRWLGGGGP